MYFAYGNNGISVAELSKDGLIEVSRKCFTPRIMPAILRVPDLMYVIEDITSLSILGMMNVFQCLRLVLLAHTNIAC
jgi:hypothetical protein